jgi:hypothetical protein
MIVGASSVADDTVDASKVLPSSIFEHRVKDLPGGEQLSEEKRRANAAASKRLSAAFGEIVSILMRSPKHRATSLSDLEWLVVPPVVMGQFCLAEARSKTNGLITPVGVVL